MPVFEAKNIQTLIEKRSFFPAYWWVGSERLKARELTLRLERALEPAAVERFDGAEISGEALLEQAQGLSLFGGMRLLVVQNASRVQGIETVLDWMKPEPVGPSEDPLPSVIVFLTDELDQRRTWVKKVIERAPVVRCDPVLEGDRARWIEFLAERRKLKLDPDRVLALSFLDPWSLEIVERELEKIEIFDEAALEASLEASVDASAPLTRTTAWSGGLWCDAFLNRRHARLLESLDWLCESSENMFQTLGLLGWNLRQLWLLKKNRPVRLPFEAEKRLKAVLGSWTPSQIGCAQMELLTVDRDLKTSFRDAKASWTVFLNQCFLSTT